MRYVYLFEDGTVKQTMTPPSTEDFNSVGDVILTLLRVDDVGIWEATGSSRWNDVEIFT